jgi:methionine biosynthesis protein MetW
MDKQFNSMRYDHYEFSDNCTVEKNRIETVLSLIGRGKKVLDVGCGDGYISEMIIQRENKVHGIEISKNSIEKVKNKEINVYEIDLNSDWKNSIQEVYDVVFAGEIIEHIFDTDRFLENIRSVLSPQGSLILTTPNIASLGRRLLLLLGSNPIIEVTARECDAGHIRYFTFQSIRKLLREHGFVVSDFSSDFVTLNFLGTMRSSLLARLFPKLGRTIIVKGNRI